MNVRPSYPDTVARALERNLIDLAAPLVVSTTIDGTIHEVIGHAKRYGYNQESLPGLVALVNDMLVGSDASRALRWPLVALPTGHHVTLMWVPEPERAHVIVADADTCNAELAERQQSANELSLAVKEKSRTIRELELARTELEAGRTLLLDAQRFQRQLVDSLAHDLGTPLAAILGYATMLSESPLLDDESARAVAAIQRNAAYLKSLRQNLLDFAHQRADAEGETPTPVDLRQLGADIDATVRPLAASKSLDYATTVHVHDDTLPVFDALKLRRILLNLLSNAVRYTEAGSVSASIDWDGQTLALDVRDTGIGIAPEHHERVFQPLNPGGQAGRQGAGLGLSIVRQLVGAMGGKLTLESAVGEGTTIRIRLPKQTRATTAAAPRTVSPEPQRETLANRVVVIADDDLMIGELLAASMEDRGFVAPRATSGDTLLAAIQASRPGAVMLDIELGGADGLELTRTLRAQGYAGVIVICSGHEQPEIVRSAFAAGANAFFSKMDLQRACTWLASLPYRPN